VQIEPDAAFTRRWQPVMVQEPSEEAALLCLKVGCPTCWAWMGGRAHKRRRGLTA